MKETADWKELLRQKMGLPEVSPQDEPEETAQEEVLPKKSQRLRVSMERSGRGGKTVTIVRGFQGSDEEIAQLGKSLKQRLGVGGSVKDGEILIQGDLRQRVIDMLQADGYRDTK